jgi:hypothetical protein
MAGTSYPERTSWSTVRALGVPEEPDAWQEAWAYLNDRYRPAMIRKARSLLTRGSGKAVAANEAEDVVGAFLLSCVEKGWLTRANPDLGRFRVFVHVLLSRFTRDKIGYDRAARRRPAEGKPASLDDDMAEAASTHAEAPQSEYDAAWVACMVDAALERVKQRSEGNHVLLQLRIGAPDAPNEIVAEQVGCRPAQVPVRTIRARRMLAEEIWSELKHTVSSRADLDEEWAALAPYLERYVDREALENEASLS